MRKKHFEFLSDMYSDEFEIVIGDNEGEFNRSAARNAGVRKATSDIVAIVDADNYIPTDQIFEAAAIAKRYDILAKPFHRFGYLTDKATDSFYFSLYSNRPYKPTSEDFINPPQVSFSGGAYVMKRSLWLDIGGMDEGFIGWGAEDDAFHIKCENILSHIETVPGIDLHLYHPAYRVTSEFNYNKLMKEYVHGYKSS